MRGYALGLLSWWKEIALGTALAAVLFGVGAWVLSLARPEFQATTDVAIVTKSEPATTPIHTFDQEESLSNTVAILGLARQGSVARAVRARLGDTLPKVPAANLLRHVDAEFVAYLGQNSNLIRITTTADTPQSATRLGNLWAEEFVAHVNRILAPVPPSVLATLEINLGTASAADTQAQRQLEDFTAENKAGALRRQLEANAAVVAKLWETYNQYATAFALGSETQPSELAENHTTQRRLRATLRRAKALRSLVANSDPAGAAANGLAIQLAKLRTFALHGNEMPETTIMLDALGSTQAGRTSAAQQRDDLDAFILALGELINTYDDANARIEQTLAGVGESANEGAAAEIAGTGKRTDAGNSTSAAPNHPLQTAMLGRIAKLENANRHLAAQIAAAEGTLARLSRDRDMAAAAVHTLYRKKADLALTAATFLGKVRVASSAILASTSHYSPIRSATVAGLLALPALALLALIANALGLRPILRRR